MKSIFTLAFVCLVALSAMAQESGNSALHGRVIDPGDLPIAGAGITLINQETGYRRAVTSGADGRFNASVLPVGNYRMEVSAQGFSTSTTENLPLSVGEARSVEIHLTVEAVAQQITVTAEAATVNPGQVAVSSSIQEEAITDLPIRGRNFTEFAQLTAGVMQESDRSGLVFAGQRSINSNVAIDGADFNDPLQGNQRGGNQAVFFFPQSAVKEFQVVRSGASAEIGRTNAGFVNVVTRSGTNDFHGDLFYFNRNKKLTSSDAFGRVLDNRQNQFGGSLGGPLRKDKAFFLVAFEQNFLRVPFVVQFDAQPAGTVIPADLLAQQGEQHGSNKPTALFIKQDITLSDKHALNIGYNFSRMRGDNFNFDSPQQNVAATANYQFRADSHAGKVGLVSVLSPRLVNEVRGQIATDERLEQPNSLQAQIVITNFGTLGSDTGRPRQFDSRRYQIADNLTLQTGNHMFRVGMDLNINTMAQQRESNILGRYDFTSLANYIARTISRYRQTLPGFDPEDLHFEGKQHELALFITDNFSIGQQIRVDAGVRWEGQWNPQPTRPNPSIPESGLIPNDLNMWQPRLGLAWTPMNGTVVRLTSGLFSARTPANLFQRVFTDNGISTVAVDSRTDARILTLIQFPNPLTALPAGLAVPVQRVFGFMPNFVNPQSAQFSATLEQAIASDLSFSVGYLRNSTWHLQRRLDRNLFPPTPNDAGLPIFPSTRPNRNFAQIELNESSAHSSYDGLILTATKRFTSRYQMQVNYTFAKNYDDDSNERNFSRETTLNPFDLKDERAFSKQDIRQNFNISGLVRGPWGVNLSSIIIARSGVPYTQVIGADQQGDANDDNDRAIINGRVAERNAVRQPNFFDMDLRLAKTFSLGERREITISGDAFNVTKHANRNFGVDAISTFGTSAVPPVTADQPLFAPSSARFGGPRQLQLGARFVF